MKKYSKILIVIAIILIFIRIINPIVAVELMSIGTIEYDPIFDNIEDHLFEEAPDVDSLKIGRSISYWNLVHIGFILLLASIFVYFIENK